LPFEFELDNPTEAETQAILLLSIDEPGKGQNRRRSTYQLWQGKLKAGETKRVGKKIHFFDKTTQSKEPGIYHLTVTVNGQQLAQRQFQFER